MHMAAELVSTNPFFDPKPAAPAPAVLPTTPPKPRNPSLDPRPADHQAAEDEQDSPPMEDAASVERSPVREGDAQFERGGFAASEQGLGSEPTFYAGPFVEAKVVRVVGCPFLAGYGSNVNSTKDEQQRHCILMHHTGMPGKIHPLMQLLPKLVSLRHRAEFGNNVH